MIIDQLYIKNFRQIQDLELEFKERFTRIDGHTDQERTSILDAIAIAAGCFLIPLGKRSTGLRTINKEDISVDALEQPVLPCEIAAKGEWGEWARRVKKLPISSSNTGLRSIISSAQELIFKTISGEDTTLPLLVYYNDPSTWAEPNHSVEYIAQGSRLEGYQSCLSAKHSPDTFRSWYKTLSKNLDKKGSVEIEERLDTFKKAILSCVEEWDDLYFDFEEDDIICMKQHEDGMCSKNLYKMMDREQRTMIGIIADLAYRCIKLNPHLGTQAITETPGLAIIDQMSSSWQPDTIHRLLTCFPKLQFVCTHSY